jgi:hypothetical protein
MTRFLTLVVLLTGLSLGPSAHAQTEPKCAPEIKKLGAEGKPGKLQGRFDRAYRGKTIRVENTDDAVRIAGNSGMWNSKEKYKSPGQTLEVLSAKGEMTGHCCYNAAGKLIPCLPCNADFGEMVAAGSKKAGTFTVGWSMDNQENVTSFEIIEVIGAGEKVVSTVLLQTDGTYDERVTADPATEGFRIKAKCDGTGALESPMIPVE